MREVGPRPSSILANHLSHLCILYSRLLQLMAERHSYNPITEQAGQLLFVEVRTLSYALLEQLHGEGTAMLARAQIEYSYKQQSASTGPFICLR